jgi:hypothetical protein
VAARGLAEHADHAVLLVLTLERATRTGYSPLGLVSKQGDTVLIETLRKWRRPLLG